ncbi:MAG: putative C-S lyase [Anaerolineae bacterium]|jgi:cystathionine beta-lyase|nr:putative C-S lyase [Anaerolineae bacterium]MBT4308865.1 putative C-S lyase [Anaerolineae bacterium]MBT4457204.1 putative C-S lyase [Anaerolineae bacterium]MBT6062583.1 putative C-S lyase [Anaerolineae bacterium]MBT6321178.1 putative C-S lyase [Anaerolineae bacterium]
MTANFDEILDRRATNSVKWNAFAEDVLPMWVADMDFAAPPAILGALHGAIGHGVLGYEFAQESLMESVAKRMQKLNGWELTAEDVIPIPGLVTGFNIAARITCKPGDGILVQPPVYYPFLNVQENTGTVTQLAELKKVTHGRTLHHEIDWDVFEGAAHSNDAKTSMFLLCHPHNPTGTVYTDEELARMVEICEREDIIICSDEIHSELLLDGNKHTPIAMVSPEAAQRTVTLIAASKTFNVAGLFVGFAIIQNPELRERFTTELAKLTIHTNSLGHIASQAAFSGECDSWLDELLVYLAANRDFVVEYVEKNLPGVRVSVPDATFLAWLDCSELVESGKIEGPLQDFFIENGKVAFNEGTSFGPGGEGFVRLNFGCPRETLVEALERMKTALA